jgi:L-fucose isomerase-like protein
MEKLRVALAGTFRPIFHGDMKGVLRHSIEVLKKKSIEMGFEFVPVEKGMETLSDGETIAKQLEDTKTDLIVIQNSSFADGNMILPFLKTSARLCVWAVEETSASGPLPLNSFCATNLYMSIAGRYSPGYEKPVKWLYGDAGSELFNKRFDTTIRALTAVKNLKSSKILAIGDLVPGYHDIQFDAKKLGDLFGVTIEKHELEEFYAEYDAATHDKGVAAKVQDIQRESSGIDVSQPDVAKSAAAEIAFEKIVSKYNGSAITFRCWPEVPGKIGLMVCSTIGRLNQTNTVAATETDMLGAISMLALKYLSGRETVLMDLSGWDKENDSIYIWHCGNIPRSWFDKSGFRLANHFNRDTIGVVRDGKMRPGKVTALRFLENDASAFLTTGLFTEQASPMYKGCSSWMNDFAMNGEAISSKDFMNTLLVNAIPHHLAFVDQDLTTEVNELCAWLGIGVMNPVSYRDYLQKPQLTVQSKL